MAGPSPPSAPPPALPRLPRHYRLATTAVVRAQAVGGRHDRGSHQDGVQNGGATPVKPPPIGGQGRPIFAALAKGQINHADGAQHRRDGDHLAAVPVTVSARCPFSAHDPGAGTGDSQPGAELVAASPGACYTPPRRGHRTSTAGQWPRSASSTPCLRLTYQSRNGQRESRTRAAMYGRVVSEGRIAAYVHARDHRRAGPPGAVVSGRTDRWIL
jgi:hypothetical protein